MAFFVGAAIGGGIAAIGDIAGSAIGSSAAGSAADKQAQAAQEAIDLQKQEFQQQQQNEQPWLDAGKTALSQMQDPSFSKTFNPSDMESVDPGYNFRMQQGQQALERSAAARGGLQSGGTLKALTQYGQDYASGEYQNAYNRFTNDQTNRFNRLSSIAGLGQNATGAVNTAGANYANNVGGLATSSASAQGKAMISQGQNWGNALSSLGGGIGGNVMQNAMMNQYMPKLNDTPIGAPSASSVGFNFHGDNLSGLQMPSFGSSYQPAPPVPLA